MINQIKESMKEIGRKENVKYVILFGSALRRSFNKESDVDVAIKFRKLPNNSKVLLKKIIRIKSKLENDLKREVDILILNKSNLGLHYEVFSTGMPVFILEEEKFFNEKKM